MPLTEGIIASLIANGLTELTRHLFPELFARDDGAALSVVLPPDPDLDTILRKAVVRVAKSAQVQDPKQSDKLTLFLISPDAESIVRQIYGIYMIPARDSKKEPMLRAEFASSMGLFLGQDPRSISEVANQLFDSLCEGCERALNRAIEQGVLSAHEAKSEFRHRLILDELSAIERNLEFLQRADKPDLDEVLKFEQKYRDQVVNRHGFITPPNVDVARKIPIKDICVAPSLIHDPTGRSKQPTEMTYGDFLSRLYRGVLLGNPGGGKSTLAGKLCHDVASEYKKRLVGGRLLTPIIVILRDYGVAKKERGCSIADFMMTVANSTYQLPPPTKAFEYMLLNGRAIVIFDGLDELLDTRDRQEVSGDIESFCTLYPSVPVLVTSREVGYDQAPLDEDRFLIFRLAPFDHRQVKEYVDKWFGADMDLTKDQKERKAKTFLEESDVVSDLRSNPLMLALMCNIYRGENYIPRNRPDVYEKCALMLFEKWDKGRGIVVPLPFEAHINPAMKFLAHWLYCDQKLQGGVTEEQLVRKATEYLCDRRFEDPIEAESASRNFIDFCTGRAWVFTDMGTTKGGEKLYQFTHRTFLEYFTAAHLVRTNATPKQLSDALLPKVERQEWDVVAQLAFQLQNKQSEGAGDELLQIVLSRAATSGEEERWNLYSFAARCLEFMVPSPKLTREIVSFCVNEVFARAPKPDAAKIHEPTELIGSLLSATNENHGPISDCLEKLLVGRARSLPPEEAAAALEVGGLLAWCLDRVKRRHLSAVYQEWYGVSGRICQECTTRIQELAPKYFSVCAIGYMRRMISIESLMERYGFDGLFYGCTFKMFPSTILTPIGYQPIYPFIMERDAAVSLKERSDELSAIGARLLEARLPWLGREAEGRSGQFWFPSLRDENPPKRGDDLNSSALFAVFGIFAVAMEIELRRGDFAELLESIKESRAWLIDRVRCILTSRFTGGDLAAVNKEIESGAFTAKQAELILAWAGRKIDFIEGSSEMEKKAKAPRHSRGSAGNS